ncbi:MAG: hypothetical protein HRU03_01525 [Nanoarchaeales archaeon]|nr:hypothetical protein [Nanoarchaeales archaeon]
MENEKDLIAWYDWDIIKFNIYDQIKNRSFDLITPRVICIDKKFKRQAFRYLKVFSGEGLDYNLEFSKTIETYKNLYCSVATLSDEFEGLLIVDRKGEKIKRAQINNNYDSYVVGYDFKIDLDLDKNLVDEDLTFDFVRSEAIKLKKLFNSNRLPFSVMFSGNKGFNITIGDKFLSGLGVDPADRPEYFLKIVTNIKNELNLRTLDLSVYTIGRVFKVAYSIERHNDLIALPLSDSQLDNFNKSKATIQSVKKLKLLKRGLMTRGGSIENVNAFFKKFDYEPKVTENKITQDVKTPEDKHILTSKEIEVASVISELHAEKIAPVSQVPGRAEPQEKKSLFTRLKNHIKWSIEDAKTKK